ncbi:MAG: GTPase Era, partial [Clostridia bacterium]|nr:GTPase Era [Clostridia bacterium]
MSEQRTAYIAIVGRPNVGKSTLMNALLGEKVAIVSNKPQTTRNRIIGILTRGDDQFVFLDTPGIFKPRNALGEFMVRTADATVGDSDVAILMVDATASITSVEEGIIENVKRSGIPCILAVNKTDLADAETVAACLSSYSERYDFDAYVPLCAKNGKNAKALLSECEKFLIESEWLFPEDMMTDQPMRQVTAEIIREK